MTDTDPAASTDAAPSAEPRGVDIARRALEEARAAAKAKGQAVGQGRRSGGVRALRRGRRRSGWSGPGPDDRDPQTLGALAGALAKSRGWAPRVNEGAVFGRWEQVVGAEIASHAQPTSLNDGVLAVSAESTAWATQLRMMQSQILAQIAASVGDGVVKQLRISGPTAPSWRKGQLHVRGRGPRDTYG
ncbi:DUF721 family protein [Rhodococcus sp. HNM0569]|uniref:DUF721 family protein n=1 Tax=Rhodococcus sp. HNM0569 TaxID=2716340 RepID=UPI001469C62A|nr:DUF721 family protein [Rhodococcus sp. HNM0569]